MPDFTSRREFLKAGSAAGLMLAASSSDAAQTAQPRASDLARLMTAPVLRREQLPSPVRIESIELIKAREYKGRDETLPVSSETSTLNCVNGVLKVPSGPGLGVTIDPAFVAKGEVIR